MSARKRKTEYEHWLDERYPGKCERCENRWWVYTGKYGSLCPSCKRANSAAPINRGATMTESDRALVMKVLQWAHTAHIICDRDADYIPVVVDGTFYEPTDLSLDELAAEFIAAQEEG